MEYYKEKVDSPNTFSFTIYLFFCYWFTSFWVSIY